MMRLPSLLRLFVCLVIVTTVVSAAQAQTLEITTGPYLGTHSVGPLQLQLTAQFGAPPYTWSVAGGSTLPSGVAIRADIPQWFPPGSAALSGVTTAPGTHTFTLIVTDSNSETASRELTLEVTALTLTDTFSFPNAFVGASYDYAIGLAGGSGTAAIVADPCCLLPPGLSIVNGHLTGTPTASGFFPISVMATDGPLTIARGFNINVYDIQISTPGVLPNGQANVAYSTPLTATGGGGSYTWQSGDIHPAFALSTAGIVSAASPPAGQYFFHATVTDGTSSFTKAFMVQVLGANPGLPELYAPILAFEDFTVGEPRSLWFSVGGGVPPYSWEVSGLPPQLALSLRAPDATNTFGWPNQVELTGTGLAPGTYTFALTVTDSSPTPIEVTRSLTLKVAQLTFDYPNFNVSLNTPFSTVLRAYGGIGSSHTATLQNPSGSFLPTGTSFNGGTLTFSGTPVEWGGFNAQLRIDDGNGHTLNRSLGFFVNSNGSSISINSFPVLPDATRNEFYNFNLWHCCEPVTWSAEAGYPLPAGLTVAANGVISGVPPTSGLYTFRIRATSVSAPTDFVIREFRLNVTPVRITSSFNLPFGNKDAAYPPASPTPYTLTADGGATGFTWEVAENSVLPPGLSLVEANGVWTLAGTPTSAGRFSFNLLVRDQSGNSRTGFFSVEIYPPGAAPPVTFAIGSDFGTWQLGPSEIGLNATGGDGTHVWSVVDPQNLPPGIRLRTDPAPWFGPNTFAGLIGVATTPGTYAFDLSVTSAGQTITQTFTVKITAFQIRDPHQLPNAFTGENYSYTFSTTSAGSPTWDVQMGTSLPAGLTLNPSTGELHGIPTTAGTYGIHVRAYDGVDYTFSNHQLVVSEIQITTPGLLFATQGEPFSQQFVATPGPAGNYHWSIGARNPGLVMSEDGLLTGTPAFAGTSFFTITATDTTTQRFYSKSIALNVAAVPAILPTLLFQDFDDWTLGQRHSLSFTTSGGTAPYSWTLLNAPPEFAHVSLRTTNAVVPPQMAELYGVVQTAGTYTFDISVTDSSSPPITITRPYTLRVSELQRSFFAPMPLTFGVTNPPATLRTIGGAMGYTYQILSGKLPAGLTLSAGGVLSGTPAETGGTFARLLITDAEARELKTGFSLFVGGGPQATVQINTGTEITTTQNQGFSFTLFACCLPSYEWALEIGSTLPPGLTISSQGVLSGIPTTAGQFLSRIRVFDPTFPANFSVREFVITVTPLTYNGTTNLPFANVGAPPYTFTLSDPGGASGPVLWEVVPGQLPLPPGLAVVESSPGVWQITGTPLTAGQFNFVLRVSRGGYSRTFSFQLSIYPAGAFPPLNLNVSGTFNQRLGRVQINLPVSNGQPPYSLAYVPGYEIPGMRVQDLDEPQPVNTPANTGTLLGVITEPGTYTTRIRATDSGSGSIERTLTIVVSPIVITTFSPMPNADVGVPYTHTLTAVGGSEPYLWTTLGSMPAGLTLSAAGVISGTPMTAGTFNFNVSAADATASATQNLQLTVQPFSITTNAVLPLATTGTPYSITLTGSGCPCTWSQVGGTIPGGLSLNTSGVLSGTPSQFGTVTFTVQATAGSQTSRKTFTAHVVPSTPQPIVLANSVLTPTTIGQQYFSALAARGGIPPYTWAHTTGQLPPGMQLLDGSLVSNNTGTDVPHLAGVPTEIGTYNFTVEYTDSSGGINLPVAGNFSILVSPLGIEYRTLPLSGTQLRYNQPYSQRMLGLGGTGSYTWSPVGQILPGLSLAASDLISGTPLNTGPFNVPITITDAGVPDALTLNVTFNVASDTGSTLIINTGSNLGVFPQGSSNSQGLSAVGGPSSPPRIYTFSLAPGSTLPPGFALVTGDSLPSGGGPASTQLVFTALAAGTFTFTLEVRDQDNNFGAKTMTVTISPYTIFTSSLPDGSAGVPYSQKLHAWGAGGTWSVAPGSALPANLGITGDVLSGTPATAGTYGFTLRVCDVALVCITRGYTLRVSTIALTDANVLPAATLGTPYSHTFAASGGGASKAFTIVGLFPGGNLPQGITLLANGVLSGTPASIGTFSFGVQVTDGASTVLKAFTLPVADQNPALVSPNPSSGSDTRYVTVGQSFSFTPSARLGRPPYTWTQSGAVPGLTLYSGATLPSSSTPGSVTFAGAPTAVGTYTVFFTATDADGDQTTVKLTLIVSPVSLVLNSLRSATRNTPYAQQLVAVGGTAPYPLFELVDESVLPTGLTMTSAGLISGTPTDTGNFTFQVQVTDSVGSSFRRSYNIVVAAATAVTLDLNQAGAIPDTPVGLGLSFTLRANVPSGTAVTWSLKSGSSMPPGVQLLTGASLPPGSPIGTAVLAGPPTAAGSHTFTLQATDASGNFGERAFTLHVPPMQIVSFTGLRDATVGVSYAGDPAIVSGVTSAQFALAPGINNLPPPGMTWNPTTGALSGVPTVAGNFTFTVRVTSGGFRLQRNFSIAIAPAAGVTPLQFGGRVLPDASVGAPLAQMLDTRAFGGVKPYTWSHGAGLPAGVSLVAGSGPHPAHLVGSPTMAGPHTFSLTVTDAVAQSITATFSMFVSSLRLSPELSQPAVVGTPYPLTLAVTGGTGPYTITPGTGTGLPPGLTRSVGATTVTFSGTPTVPGRYGMGFTVTDNVGATLSRGFGINVDATATPTPYIALNPTAVNITYVQNGPPPAPFPVTITTSSTAADFTAMLAGVPAASLSVTNGTTPRTTNIVFEPVALAGLSPATYYGFLTVNAPQTMTQIMSIPVALKVEPAPPCTYEIGPPTSATAPSDVLGGAPGTFSLTAGPSCPWTAVSNQTWLVVNPGAASGFGNATIDYTVTQDNTTQSPRVGTITVQGKTFTVTQFGMNCSYVLSNTALAPQVGGSTDNLTVSTSQPACSWSATSSVPWAQITAPANGTGTGPLQIVTTASAEVNPRIGTVTLFDGLSAAVGTVTITQAGVGCGVTLSESGISLPAGGSESQRSGSVDVTIAPCGYTTVPPPQVTITSGGSSAGTGTVQFTVAENVSTEPRLLAMQIGDQSFTIEQTGMTCLVGVSGSNPVFNASGGAGSLTVTSNVPTCDWSSASGATWLLIDSGHTGEGNGSVTFTVAANSSPQPRSTMLNVGGNSVQINQGGITCSYGLRSPSASMPASGGSGSAGVLAASACTWTATSNTGWLAIASSDNAGTGYVSFLASANPAATERTGSLTIAGQTFTVTQPGAPCTYTLSNPGATVINTGGSGSFTFSTTTAGCTPAVQSYSGWITDVTHNFAGTSGTVNFTVQPNPFGVTRIGRILAGDQTYTVTQEGAACMYSLHAPSATFSAAGGNGELLATGTATGCTPAVGSSPEITLGPLTPPPPLFLQPYTVQPFASSVTWVRTMTINFGGVNFAVKQTSW